MNTEAENYIIKEGKLYQNAFLNFSEREIGLISEDKTIELYIANFSKLENSVNELLAKIKSEENKGSFLSHLENLKNEITTFEGVGNVEELYTKVSAVEVELHQQIRKNRERNLAVKQAFIEEVEVLAKESDTTLVVERIKDIRTKWIRVGAVEKELQEELNNKFKVITDVFFDKYNKAIEGELIEYKKLVEESVSLKDSKEFNSTRKRIIEIQQEWKMLPQIPKNEFVPLFKLLRTSHDTFFENLKKDKKSKAGNEFEKNLKSKNEIIAEASSLLDNIAKTSIKDLKTVQDKWRKSGRVNKDKGDALWDEFSLICEKIFEFKTLDIQVSKFFKGDKSVKSEVLKFKIKELQNSLKKEEHKLKTVEDNLGSFRLNISSKKIENQFLSKDKNIERKLEVKKALITTLREELAKH